LTPVSPHHPPGSSLVQGHVGDCWMNLGAHSGECWGSQSQNDNIGWIPQAGMSAACDNSSVTHHEGGFGLSLPAENVPGDSQQADGHISPSRLILSNTAFSWMPIGQDAVPHLWSGAFAEQVLSGANVQSCPPQLMGPQGGQMPNGGGLRIARPDVYGIRMASAHVRTEPNMAIDGNGTPQEHGAALRTPGNPPDKTNLGIAGGCYTTIGTSSGEPLSGSTSTGPGTPEQYASYPVPHIHNANSGISTGSPARQDWDKQLTTFS